MRTRIALVPALLLSLAPGCGDASGPGTEQALELVERYAQWRERGRSSYSFDYHETCTCGAADGVVRMDVRVTVIQGTVTSLTPLVPGEPVPFEAPFAYPTIESIFERLGGILRADASRFDVDYDDGLDFPARGEIRWGGPGFGVDLIFEVRNFGPPDGYYVLGDRR